MAGTTPHIALERPSAWVARFAPLVPPGLVLDLACGGGRHSKLFAALGHEVLAVDRNADALSALAAAGNSRIQTLQVDLELPQASALLQPGWPLQHGRYAGIVVTNYLHRPLLPHLVASLQEGGVLIYETFAAGNERYGKPSSPAFLLQPGELLQALAATAQPMRVIAFEDGFVPGERPAMVQRICALRGAAANDSSLSL
ncbi:MAG: methyltransferase protein [Paucimonas sp.]|nr:methyltransferase protein [Paucimonas sp.]